MNVRMTGFNTLPSKKEWFWQVVLLPTISVLRNVEKNPPYVAVNFEWLFWSFSLIFQNEKTN